jgi:uncharacterized protein (DUF302 family)
MPLLTATSEHGVRATVDRVVASLERRGIEIFARVDHAKGARDVGLQLADEELLIFGDPKAGTPLMQSDASIGYELPLKILVWDDRGTTRVAYRAATELARSFAVAERAALLGRMDAQLAEIVGEST